MKGNEVEACRTCGIFFLTSSNFLRCLFDNDPDISLVRQELEHWKVQLNEADVYPKYICTICLMEFHRIFKFQRNVLGTQQQFQQLFNLQQENLQKIKIKTEIDIDIDENPISGAEKSTPMLSIAEEPNVCAFVYVDDLSDDEQEAGDGGGGHKNVSPFKVPHVPIKREMIDDEEAFIAQAGECLPNEMSVLALTTTLPPNETTTAAVTPETLTEQIMDNHVTEAAAAIPCQLCLHISENQQQHRQHLLSIHETKPVECHVCGKQFPPGTTETRLKYHTKWHRISKHIKCSLCGFYCASRENLKEHKRAVHTKIPCKICGKLLLPRRMRNHLDKHKQTENDLNCAYCGSSFATNEERTQHIALFHNSTNDQQLSQSAFNVSSAADGGATTTSSSCETSLTTTAASSSPTYNAANYSNVAEAEATYESSLTSDADEASAENAAYNDEQMNADSLDEDSYAAETHTFDTHDDEQSPTLTVNDEMPFTCVQCPQRFANIEQLIAHSEGNCCDQAPKDETIESFKCHICDRVFELKFLLNRHLKRHKSAKREV